MLKNAFTKIAVIAAVGALSQAALAQDGTVNFVGEVTDSICGIAPNSVNQTVDLGRPNKGAFPTVGSGFDYKNFELGLRDCPATATKAKVTFQGTADTLNAELLAIDRVNGTGDPTAKGVAIEISDWGKVKIPLGQASREYIIAEGDNDLKFFARYVSTLPVTPAAPNGPALTPGSATGSAQFTVAYN
ncbi:fimbrial protein [Variovorax paradoxus]|jgi:major type 1 subunit fimbrin (pilin)|uniref:fimbrial protein n=1 Tax=Variovorax paradoxus TaxID=34073 RepID=UPI0007D8FFB3